MRGTFLWLAALLPVTLAPRGLGNPRSQGYHDERLQRIFTALGVADDSSSTFVEFGWYFEWGSNTAALLRHLPTPGRPLEVTMREVRAEVLAQTRQAQKPWENSCLTESVVLMPGETAEQRAARVFSRWKQ